MSSFTDPQSSDFNQKSLYFLTKKQLIDLCCEKKVVLNQSEAMLISLASQLAKHTDELNEMQTLKDKNDNETKSKRMELRNLTNYSLNFND